MIRSTPEAQGVSSSALLRFVEALDAGEQEIHSLMLLRNGSVIAEGWWSPYGRDIPHTMFSLSKSFTSTAVGMAIAEAYFGLDDLVTSFFPDIAPTTGYWAALKVRHLLSMSTGHAEKPFPAMYGQAEGNWAKGFFEVPLVYEPGSFFLYNTGASYMLSEIVQRRTGLNLMDFLRPRLFEPLGIEGAKWQQAPHGITLGGIGLSLKTEDIARFGQLYLQKGNWQGQQLISEAWVKEATSAQVSNGDNPGSDWTQGYGYQFWRCQHGFYRGDGAFGQFCIVMEQFNAVLAMTAAAKDMQVVMNMVWDILVPAFESAPSPEDAANHAKLLEKLSSLHHAPLKGLASSPKAEAVSGKCYWLEANVLGIESLSLDFSEAGSALRLKTKDGEELIRADYGNWQVGESAIFDEIWLSGKQAIVASGAWQDDDTYQMLVRLYETAYVYSLSFQFAGNSLSIRIEINVSLESTAPHILKAIRV